MVAPQVETEEEAEERQMIDTNWMTIKPEEKKYFSINLKSAKAET